MRSTKTSVVFSACTCVSVLFPAYGSSQSNPSLNMFGNPGLIDMPSAESNPDAELSLSVSHFAKATRTSLNFQISPRISGTFRYARIDNWFNGSETFDRSFDIRFKLLNESKFLPAVALGLRDFMGTGLYSSQYLVATKNLGDTFKVTAGLGWGRLSGTKKFQPLNFGRGGKPNYKEWFRGDVGVFGGLEWQTPIDGLRVKVEYSPDQYVWENRIFQRRRVKTFDRKSPVNFGFSYVTKRNLQFSGYYMYGSEIGFSFSTSLNPKRKRQLYRALPEQRVLAIRQRPQGVSTASFADGFDKVTTQSYTEQLQKALGKKTVQVIYANYNGGSAEVRIRNAKFNRPGQAAEHTMRAMTQVLPDGIENFSVVLMENDLPISTVHAKRSDIEALGRDGTGGNFGQLVQVDAGQKASGDGFYTDGIYPKFTSYLRPFLKPHLFDPDDPVRADFRIGWNSVYDIKPGLSISSEVSAKVLGNLDNNKRASNSVLLHVRTDLDKYQRNSAFTIDRLTIDYMTKLSPSVYARVSAGIFEQMYGGISAEVLWKPIDSRLAFGAEVNWVKKRGFDQRLSFQNFSTVTGHVSAYWDMGNSYYGQIDVGRYLAHDLGATFTFERRFDNGWRIGAFATFTNVSFADFGEGSFDKGINVTIPFSWLAGGQPTRRRHNLVIRSITRDGGARVDIPNRLYGIVSDAGKKQIVNSW